MKFDSLILCAVVDELRETLVGARVSHVVQPEVDTVCLGFRRGGERAGLLLSAGAADCRAHLTESLPDGPDTPPNFCALLRKFLLSAEVVALRQISFDRLLHLDFAGTDRIGNPRSWRLIGEFMGKHSNLVLVDEEGVIVACLKHVTHRVNRYREVLPGRAYVPPPQGDKEEGLRLTEEAYRARWFVGGVNPLKDTFRSALLGLSDDFWRLLCSRAGLNPEATFADAPPDAADRLWSAWQSVRLAADAGAWSPTLYRGSRGEPRQAYPFPLGSEVGGTAEPAPSLSAALEIVSDAERKRAWEEQLRQTLCQRLAQTLRQVRRRCADTARALAQAEDPEGYKIKGDLILACLSQITPGQKQVEVVNYYDPDLAPLTIELDPLLDGPANAQRYFTAAARARRAMEHLPGRLARLEEDRETLERLQQQVEQAPDQAALARLQPAVEAATGPASGTPADRPRRPRTPREAGWDKLETHVSRDGYEIVVGKNAQQNEFVLSRVAAPTDLWFHVRGAGSGHVIVRTGGHPERVPPTTLQEAAVLAARHSRAKHSALVPVSYTQRKYVTKVKGAGSGQVTYRHEKTLFVEPSAVSRQQSAVRPGG
jgi:predicted ribosome quality control (RQC) complex YloA/Tae2 family protein